MFAVGGSTLAMSAGVLGPSTSVFGMSSCTRANMTCGQQEKPPWAAWTGSRLTPAAVALCHLRVGPSATMRVVAIRKGPCASQSSCVCCEYAVRHSPNKASADCYLVALSCYRTCLHEWTTHQHVVTAGTHMQAQSCSAVLCMSSLYCTSNRMACLT